MDSKTIEVKFAIGQDVVHFTGIHGRITAIFHRGGKNGYEMSYLEESKPTSVTCEECELEADQPNSIGFRKQTNGD